MKLGAHRGVAIAAGVALAVASVRAQGITQPKQGQGGSVRQKRRRNRGSTGDNGLEKCDRPMGALAVVEPQDLILASLRRYNLASPVGLIRLMIQQSNCFIVVERGAGMQNMMRAGARLGRPIAAGFLNVGGGQMVSADGILTPPSVFSESNAGGVGGALGGVLGRRSPVIGDRWRSEIQRGPRRACWSPTRAAAFRWRPRKAARRKRTCGSAARCSAVPAAQRAAAMATRTRARSSPRRSWTTTMASPETVPERPQPAASRGHSQGRGRNRRRDEDGRGSSRRRRCGRAEIANIKLLAQPGDTSKIVAASCARNDELVVVGVVKDGYVNVQSASATG